jgi:hypothetical protein
MSLSSALAVTGVPSVLSRGSLYYDLPQREGIEVGRRQVALLLCRMAAEASESAELHLSEPRNPS